jgi:hypothetical protein
MRSNTRHILNSFVIAVLLNFFADAFAPSAHRSQRKTHLGYVLDTEVEGTTAPNVSMKIGPLERIYPKGQEGVESKSEKDPNMMAQGLADLAFHAEMERVKNGSNKRFNEQIEQDMAMVRAHIAQKRREMKEAEELAKAEAAWREANPPPPEVMEEKAQIFRSNVFTLAKKRSTIFSAIILVAVKRLVLMWLGVGLSPF